MNMIKNTLGTLALALSVAAMSQTAYAQSASDDGGWMNTFYFSVGAGKSSVDLKAESRNEEGIDFNFEGTDDDDMATTYLAGIRLSDIFAIEGGLMDLGTVDQNFTFNDPRDGDSGSGLLKVSPSGIYMGAMLTTDIEFVQLFAKAGVLKWDYDMDLRFDVATDDGAVSQYRDFSKDGTSLLYGAGARIKVANNWSVGFEASFTDIDGDDITIYGGSVLFDVAGWANSVLQ